MDDTDLIKVLKALAEPKRFRIVQEIAAAGELSCGEVGEKFTHSQPTMSHHIKILSDCGLLVGRSEGQHHYISVNQQLLAEVMKLLPRRLAPGKRTKAA